MYEELPAGRSQFMFASSAGRWLGDAEAGMNGASAPNNLMRFNASAVHVPHTNQLAFARA